MTETTRTLFVDGVALRTTITRKRVRNVNARLAEGELRVSAPMRISRGELDEIVHTLARRLLRRARAERINSTDEGIELARRVAARFPSPPRITELRFVTNQRSRWGSYNHRSGVVRLNAALRELPRWVLEAVVAHELAHAVHPDHSAKFWALLREACPRTDRARAFLEGVTWLAGRWDELPPVERSLLVGPGSS